MKSLKIIGSILFLALLTSSITLAQSFSYVDTEYILDKIPEYKSAQKQLNEFAEKWKADIRVKVDEIDKLYKAYQAEQVLLPDDIRKKREDEILKKEDELNKPEAGGDK